MAEQSRHDEPADDAGSTGSETWRLRIGEQHVQVLSSSEPAVPAGLTQAELKIFNALRAGWSDERIARQRGTSPRTVSNQVRKLFQRLSVTSRREFWARFA